MTILSSSLLEGEIYSIPAEYDPFLSNQPPLLCILLSSFINPYEANHHINIEYSNTPIQLIDMF